MPFEIPGTREGKVIFLCVPEETYQESFEDPPYATTEYAPWFALEQLVYEHVIFGYIWPAPSYQTDNYTFLTGMGPTELGYYQNSARVVQPFKYVNAMSWWKDPAGFLLPDLDPYNKSPLDLIPADAWIKWVDYKLFYSLQPEEYGYEIQELSHNNTLLPQPNGPNIFDQGGMLPGQDVPTTAPEDFTWLTDTHLYEDTDPNLINARDAILQDFDLKFALRHASGTSETEIPPLFRCPMLVMEIGWRAVESRELDNYSTPMTFGMTATGDIKRNRTLAGALAASMIPAADIKLIGNLAGDVSMPMSNIADATNNEGGVDNGIDNTGWFNADLSFESDMKGQLKLDGECVMQMVAAAEVERIGNLAGVMAGGLSLNASPLKDGRLWVEEDSLVMTMTLNSPELLSTRSLVGAFNASMVVTGDLKAERQLVGAFSASMDSTGIMLRIRPLEGVFPATMVGTGEINRLKNIAGAFTGSLSIQGEIFRLYGEHAPSEQTVWMTKKCGTVKMGHRENEIIMDTRKRN